MSSKNKKLNIDKDELYNLYIIQQLTSKEIGDIYGCSSKCIRNYLAKYNIPIRQNGEAVKLERSKWSQEKEQTRTLKFITTWNNKSQEEKERIMSKAQSKSNTPLSIQKARETKLNNNTYTKSLAEDNYYKYLQLFFNKDDIIRGYIDSRYPFNCDFYIKSKDLFIEYQGHQTHGYEPYDVENINHYNYLNNMINKGYDMKTWTDRDVHKINIASQNKIKLLLIYPKNNTYLIKNGKITNLGKSTTININDID